MTESILWRSMQKTLAELKEERANKRMELSEIYKRFVRDFEIPRSAIKEPIDPKSDYGKLIIGGRLKLPQGSKLLPTFKILMAKAQYEHIKLNELIELKQQESEKITNSNSEIHETEANCFKLFSPVQKNAVVPVTSIGEVALRDATSACIDSSNQELHAINANSVEADDQKRRRRRPRGGVKHRNNKENRKKRMMEAAQQVEGQVVIAPEDKVLNTMISSDSISTEHDATADIAVGSNNSGTSKSKTESALSPSPPDFIDTSTTNAADKTTDV